MCQCGLNLPNMEKAGCLAADGPEEDAEAVLDGAAVAAAAAALRTAALPPDTRDELLQQLAPLLPDRPSDGLEGADTVAAAQKVALATAVVCPLLVQCGQVLQQQALQAPFATSLRLLCFNLRFPC